MTTYFRTAVLFVALIALAAIASCTGTATPGFTPVGRDVAAKPAVPVAAPAVYPAEASAPVLARFYDAGSTAAGEATIVRWEWNFGGGWQDHTATAGEVWKTFSRTGTVAAQLRVTDSAGHS